MADAPENAAADPAAAGGKKPILLIAAVLVALGAGGAAGALVVGPALAAGVAPAAVEAGLHAKKGAAHGDEGDDEAGADDEEGAESDEEEGEGEHKGGEKGAEGKDAATVYVIDNLVLNPAASGGTRFLLLTVAFDMKSAALAEQIKARDPEVRDAVLSALGAKTVEQLTDAAGRELIKEELKVVVGKLVKKKTGVRRVYFPQFVIQ